MTPDKQPVRVCYVFFLLHASCPLSHVSCLKSPLVEMWWLIGSAPDFWGKGPGFESGVSHKDPEALQDHCVIM